MSLIHEGLYQSENLSEVPFAEYLRRMASDILVTDELKGSNHEIVFELSDIKLSVDKAIPCGLAASELVTNALKYAFPDGRVGKVVLSLRRLSSTEASLSVSDDGISKPSDAKEGLGLTLVPMLVEQLGGNLHVNRDHGTTYDIHFPL